MSEGAPAGDRLRTVVTTTGRAARSVWRRQPVSIVIAVVLVVLALASGGALRGPSEAFRDMVGAGPEDPSRPAVWLRPLTSVLFASDLVELIVAVVLVLVLVGAAERRLGAAATVVAFVVTGAVASAAGIGVQLLGLAVGDVWAIEVAHSSTLHPFTPALGTIMAASASAGPLWRRRIRLIGFSAIVTFLLYNGHPSGLFALFGALTGLAIGPALRSWRARRQGRPVVKEARWARSSHHEVRRLASTLVAIAAIGPVVTLTAHTPIGALSPLGILFRDVLPRGALSRACGSVIRVHLDPRLLHGAACTRDAALLNLNGPGTVLLGLLPLVTLLVSAYFLRRGRRIAVYVAAAVNLLLATLAAFYYLYLPVSTDTLVDAPRHVVERGLLIALSVLVPLTVAVGLLVLRRHFTVREPRRAVRRYVAVVLASLVGLGALFAVVGWLGRSTFTAPISVGTLLLDTPERFIPVGFIGLDRLGPVPVDGIVRVVYEGVGPVWWLIVLVGLVLTVRRAADPAAERDHARVGEILHRGVPGPLSFMATWPGNDYWFSADGEAAVAYRVVGGVAITTGDPLCPDDRAAEVVAQFSRWCDDQGWTPVFYSVRAFVASIYTDMGWSTLPVGEETVLHPQTFAMQGKKWQDVRSSINRAEKNGVRALWSRYAELTPAVARQITEISEEWVAGKELPEMGFTLGGVDELVDPEVAVLLALDADDTVLAVTSWLPSYADGVVVGWTLDFMRRRPDSMNGVMEFLIASAALITKDQGVDFLSLSAAPLAQAPGADPEEARSQTDRLLAFLSRTLEPSYGFRSLFAFKQKFQPELVPLVMAYPDPVQLPAIGTALGRAYLPDLTLAQTARLLRGGR
ncbi:bifunctional lysylphosphatidylglycerol flippase/synthetase MprF [Frigoribacterium sp. 2-23]|uniref:bifunctional lysylphosphatidylglycerol flippase/synthetase MprF n=1 Tax=Frigoribacterium sp. 2-23 TaxID=3415006 RepID=UPI003C70014A